MIPERRPTRKVKIGSIFIGEGEPIAVQSMCATRTQDIDATVQQTEQLRSSGAAIVRIAIDSDKDAEALKEIRTSNYGDFECRSSRKLSFGCKDRGSCR